MNAKFTTAKPSPFSALVVEPTHVDAVFIVSALTSAGFTVTLTDTFQHAKTLLQTHPFLVVITEVRLGAFNGLHLALHFSAEAPRRTVIVTSSYQDAVLQRDAEQAGATFVLKPVTAPDLLAAVYRTALRRTNPDGTVDPIRPPFERRRVERRREVGAIESERRHGERRRDIAGLMLRTLSLQ